MPGVSFRSIPLFRGLTPTEVAHFAEAAEEVDHTAGDLIMVAGGPAVALYYVVHGEITVKAFDDNGRPTMVSIIAPGHMAGWSALVPPHIATATLTALTDCSTIRFDGMRLRELSDANPRLGLMVMRNLGSIISERLACTTSRLATALDHIRSRGE